MKHKAFLVLIVLGFTFGSIALADYLEPSATAPGSNTPEVVKTSSSTPTLIYEKIGIGEGTTETLTNLAANPTSSSYTTNGSYIGSGVGSKGGFIEKLLVYGVSSTISGSTPQNLLIKIDDKSSNSTLFDQYKNGTQYEYPIGASKKMTKALEAIVAGRYVSTFAITNDEDNASRAGSKPNLFSLDFQTTNSFSPTTNIGLGDTCDLYAGDLGTTISDGGGCPKGSYMSWYKDPTISGTVSSSNNNNGVALAKCTRFSPSASPTNTGHCTTSRPAAVTVSWASQVPDKCRISIPSQCWSPTAYYYKESGWTNWVGYSGATYGDCSTFTPGRTYAFDGTCPSGTVMTQPASFAVDSYKTIHSVNINNSVLKMPSTLNGNIKWYYGSGPSESTSDRDKTQVEGATIDRVRITDLYGQYIERTK